MSSVSNTEKTGAPVVPAPAAKEVEDQNQSSDAAVTPQPPVAESVLNREERVEYRDQDGNILDEKQVSLLEGKVSFSTRYETRTRIIDANGKEVADGPAGAEGFAPPHPDVDRLPETAVNANEDHERDSPATVSLDNDSAKEKSVNEVKSEQPRPASEGRDATK